MTEIPLAKGEWGQPDFRILIRAIAFRFGCIFHLTPSKLVQVEDSAPPLDTHGEGREHSDFRILVTGFALDFDCIFLNSFLTYSWLPRSAYPHPLKGSFRPTNCWPVNLNSGQHTHALPASAKRNAEKKNIQ